MGYNVVLITGGASGLGEASARVFSAAGYSVAILDLNEERGNALVQELGQDRTVFIKTNVTEESEVQNAIKTTVSRFGAVHVILNSAGILTAQTLVSSRGVACTKTLMKVLAVNVAGTFNVCKYGAQQMAQQQPALEDGSRGVIVNISSVAGIEGQNGQTIYSASKGAIIGMTVPMARDLGRYNIRVVTLAPGVFKTPMAHFITEKVEQSISSQVPLGRLGKPEEFGETVLNIVNCSYINAEVIRLDGGVRLPKL